MITATLETDFLVHFRLRDGGMKSVFSASRYLADGVQRPDSSKVLRRRIWSFLANGLRGENKQKTGIKLSS